MRHLVRLLGERLVVEVARSLGVEREVELVLPAKLETRARKRIVADLRCRMPLGEVCRMGRDLVGDDARLHIVAVGQAQMLLRRDIAEHGRAEPADHRRANAARDVVIAGRNVGRERPKRIEGCLAADIELLVHILLDLVHRHMAGALDHHLAVLLPGDLRQLAQRLQLSKLRGVIGIGDGARTQAIAQREGHVIGAADVADFLKMLVEEALPVVMQAPLGHDRATARDDARHPIDHQRNVMQSHSRMDGEIVDALLGLLDQRIAEYLPVQILGNAVHLLQRLIDRHRANRHGRIADDPFADVVDVATGGKVHHRVAAPARRPHHLVHLLGHGGGDSGIADIGVDLHEEVAADDHRLGFRVVDVGGNDRPALRHLVTHEFRRHEIGDGRAKALAIARLCGSCLFASEIFADSDIFHLRRDDAGPRIGKLRDGLAVLCPQRLVARWKLWRQPVAGNKTIVLRLHMAALIGLHIAARLHPGLADARQTLFNLDQRVRIGIGTGGIIDCHRRLAGARVHGDLAHGHANTGVKFAGFVDLARRRQWAGGHFRSDSIHGSEPPLLSQQWRPSSCREEEER